MVTTGPGNRRAREGRASAGPLIWLVVRGLAWVSGGAADLAVARAKGGCTC